MDPELWFPERGESGSFAKAICATCSVQAECLEAAEFRGERHGIWGGLGEGSRRIRRRGQPLIPASALSQPRQLQGSSDSR